MSHEVRDGVATLRRRCEMNILRTAAGTVLGFAGPSRALPDRRAHELFEERVRECPNSIAAMRGDLYLTYRDLNARANQLARALLARGLSREAVVGVVTERKLDWMTGVLAILKAGGAYLPIEPHFPADRIAKTL